MSDTEIRKRALAIFDEVADLDTAQREQRLRELCGDNAGLRAQVQALLDADAGTVEPISGDAAAWGDAMARDDVPDAMTGRSIGAWKIVGTIGRGGMGAVYSVERSDGAYAQQAALKLIRASADSPAARERFLRERQILAGLRHPNIASLLDGGISADGELYFVMERVDGLPIDRWCDEHALDVHDRVELFLQVLDAVRHAHRNLVMHRDLKPSNLLVDKDGRVKLLDFGIAKQMEGSELTVTVDRALTFEYASPEQLHDAPITTATDIWQLGVVLHRLLSGSHPFGLTRDTPVASQLQQLEKEPASLSRAQYGSLADIVQACLRRDPEARYASADALANDLRAWLDNRPIAAVPLSRGERARLWLRRNRTLATSIAAIAIALLAGTGIALWQANEARRESARARESLQFLSDTLAATSPEQAMSTQVSVRQLLDSARAKLDARNNADPQVKQPVQRLLGRLYNLLGEPRIAAPLLEQGLRGVVPDNREDALALADDLGEYSNALGVMERGKESLIVARRAADLRLRFAPNDPQAKLHTHNELGFSYYADNEHKKADAEWTQALAIARAMPKPPVDTVIDVSQMMASMANFDGDLERSLKLADQGLAFADHNSVPADAPKRVNLLRARGEALQKLGNPAEAETTLRRAIAIQQKTTSDGGNRMALLQNGLGMALNDLGRYREALQAIAKGGQIAAAATLAPTDDAITQMNLASVNESAGNYAEALRLGRQALAKLDEAGLSADDATRRMFERNYTRALGLAGQQPQAFARMTTLQQRAKALDGDNSSEYAFTTWQLVVMARHMHDPARGLPLLEDARKHLASLVPDAHPVFTNALRAEASFARDNHDLAHAETALREALGRFIAAGAIPVDVAGANAELADILFDRGDRGAARKLLKQALPVLRESVEPQELTRADAEKLAKRLGM